MADSAAIHREMLETVNRRDVAGYRELLHDDYTYQGADGSEAAGPDAGVAQVEPFLAAFDDLRLVPVHQFVDGDTSVIEAIGTGTHTGELAGIPATGRSVTMHVCNVIEVRDGKVLREREYYNEVSLMQQLGVMPTE